MLQTQAFDHLAQDARCIRPRLTGLVRLPNRLQSKLQAGLVLSALLKEMHTSFTPAGHCSTAYSKNVLIAPMYSQEAQRRSKAMGPTRECPIMDYRIWATRVWRHLNKERSVLCSLRRPDAADVLGLGIDAVIAPQHAPERGGLEA